MSKQPAASNWLSDNGIECVETIVPDFAGIARGKILPVCQFGEKNYKLPIAVFGQTINGTYHMPQDNVEAFMWFNLAGLKGSKDAREARDMVAERMTEEQIIEAHRRTREWRPQDLVVSD